MSYGTCLLVSAGMSEYKCWFISYVDDTHMLCLNRCGKQITVADCDVLETYL